MAQQRLRDVDEIGRQVRHPVSSVFDRAARVVVNGRAGVLRQLVDKIDPLKTYMNMITSKGPEGARIPMTLESDRQALYIAIACCLDTQVESARIARIRSTKYVEDLWVSEPFLDQVLSTGRVELVNEPGPILFDSNGMFAEGW